MTRPRAVRLGLLVGGLGFMLLLFSCRELPTDDGTFPGDIVSAPKVRVGVKVGPGAKGVASLTLAVHGPFRLFGGPDTTAAQIPIGNRYLSKVIVRPDPREGSTGFLFKDQYLRHPVITVVPNRNGDVFLDGVRHYGSVTLRRVPGRQMLVINNVSLDPYYVAGVIYAEVPWQKWNEEALKAQAVASRTYALYEVRTRTDKPYDVVAGSRSQEFSSGFSKNSRLARVIRQTLGVVMTWQGRLFPAFFHSSCGGYTEDAKDVFIRDPITPLSGVPCPYCKLPENKYRSWKVTIPNREIEEKIGPYVYDNLNKMRVRKIRAIETLEGGISKRAVRLKVIHAFRPFEIDANRFRNLVGTVKLPSTKFICVSDEKKTTFTGSGWGHGVGMCQWGCEGMARKGKNYQQILKHYYPGGELVRLPYWTEK